MSGTVSDIINRILSVCIPVVPLFGITRESEANAERIRASVIKVSADVWRRYEVKKQQCGALDHDDLLTMCIRMFEENTGVRQRYRRQFKHLMVDEFQDTDPLQMRILELLQATDRGAVHAGARNVSDTYVSQTCTFIVGDSRQSIYGFRSADPTIFRSIETKHRASNNAEHVEIERELPLASGNRCDCESRVWQDLEGRCVTIRTVGVRR